MVRSMWMPVTSGVATLCLGASLWPQVAPTVTGLSLFGVSADAGIKSPIDELLQRLPIVGRGVAWSMSSGEGLAPQDLRVGNLSVHRIRYERGEQNGDVDADSESKDQEAVRQEETMGRSLFGSAWAAAARKAFTQPISSIVVTWEDHPLAAELRPEGQTMCAVTEDAVEDNSSTCHAADDETMTSTKRTSGREVQYEVQVWVNGWGFDAFWHPANRKLSTSDPFVVLNELPQEQELGFRVRMKVKTKTGLLSGFFATEVEGPWSDAVTLTPSKEHAIEAIVAFFLANKMFGAVLALCIGLGILVILRLVVSSLVYGKPDASGVLVASSGSPLLPTDSHFHDHVPRVGRRRATTLPVSMGGVDDLEQEVADLRQELADSEAEVRRLMLFRGYGIEELRENELEELELELRRSLKLVQKRRRLQSANPDAFEPLDDTEDEDGEDDMEVPAAVSGSMHATQNGALHTLFEGDIEA